jgi:hypothetical protein
MNALSTRLMRSDFIQLSTLFFAILLFSLMISWPQSQEENRSWYMLVQTRITGLTLLALGFGSQCAKAKKPEPLVTLLALLSLGVLTLPLEMAAYAASFPGTPLWWSLGITLLDTVAFFGLGVALAAVFHRLHLQALLPVVNLVIFVLFLTFDFGLPIVLMNSLLAVTVLSPYHLGAMLVATSLTALWIVRS